MKPEALGNCESFHPIRYGFQPTQGERTIIDRISFTAKPMGAVKGADALLIVTEWKAYRSPNLVALKAAMKNAVIFVGRNLYDLEAMVLEDFDYYAIGRQSKPGMEYRHAATVIPNA